MPVPPIAQLTRTSLAGSTAPWMNVSTDSAATTPAPQPRRNPFRNRANLVGF